MGFLRAFHVEMLRGGMNRLLLRAPPTDAQPQRVEVLFQYVQYMNIPMAFDGLAIEDRTREDREVDPWDAVLVEYPELRIFRLMSGGVIRGRVAAASCSYGEDEEPVGAPSMFFMMD